MILRSKKGTTADLMLVLVILITFAVITLVGYKFVGDVSTHINNTDLLDNASKEYVSDADDRFASLFDWVFVMIFILLWGGIIVFAWVIDTHPAYFFIALAVFVAIIIIGALGNNIFSEAATSPMLSGLSDNFPKISFIMDNFLMFAIFIVMTSAIALYAKSQTYG